MIQLRVTGMTCGHCELAVKKALAAVPGVEQVISVDRAGESAGRGSGVKIKSHGLRLDAATREQAKRRLLSIRGHVEGVMRMLDDDQIYCVDALKQLKAVSGALDKVGALVLQSHLRDHVATAAQRGDADTIVEELMEVMKYR
jgi:DNA-binding FrmR family transcriptional regulator